MAFERHPACYSPHSGLMKRQKLQKCPFCRRSASARPTDLLADMEHGASSSMRRLAFLSSSSNSADALFPCVLLHTCAHLDLLFHMGGLSTHVNQWRDAFDMELNDKGEWCWGPGVKRL